MDRVDIIIQFALAVAAEADDYRDRELSPIHLIKYLYLADLVYAARSQGETFSGVAWRFHHFGPWSPDAFLRIEPAAAAVGATHRVWESTQYERDTQLWLLKGVPSNAKMFSDVPISIRLHLKKMIGEFGRDTGGLLHHVYSTPPMLQAAPGDCLDFSAVVEAPSTAIAAEQPVRIKTTRQKKKERERLNTLRAAFHAKLEERRAQRKPRYYPPEPTPEEFERVTHWLDSMGGIPTELKRGELEVDASVWKSDSRTNGKLP